MNAETYLLCLSLLDEIFCETEWDAEDLKIVYYSFPQECQVLFQQGYFHNIVDTI
jgi:hypothetical protein